MTAWNGTHLLGLSDKKEKWGGGQNTGCHLHFKK